MKIDTQTIREIETHLNADELIYMPTDTIPGLVCRALAKPAVEQIYVLKNRDSNKPPTIIIAHYAQLKLLGIALDDATKRLLDTYWPGPVSIVLPIKQLSAFDYLHRGAESLAIRLTSEPWLHSIVESTGPLATSSANIQGQPPASSPDEAHRYFGNNITYYAHHPTSENKPSTILRMEEDGQLTKLR